MQRLFSGLGYVFFAVFAINALLPDDAPVTKEFTPHAIDSPLLKLDEGKSALLDDAARPIALKQPAEPVEKPNARTIPRYLYVTANSLNVRSGPAQSNKRIGALTRGAKVAVIEQSGGWTRINGSRDGTAVSGWVSSKYISALAPKATPVAPKKTVRSVATPSSRDITMARKAIIRQSIAAYPGSCPCDYNHDRAGRRCGKRSAWSRRGGYAPLCYDSDVTQAHLKSYFARRR
ncbi:MAG: SH3 domain-containing protein [Planktotalea sp.]|uniref:SH3 domain-containing protein n=1 Tax=Planktotalea sp. TaxID=2029877 RepID=UPI003C771E6D